MRLKVFERAEPEERAGVAARVRKHILNVVVVYDDGRTRKWARETCKKVSRQVGEKAMRSTWWRLGDLGHPAVLAGAVSKGMRADMLVVAVRAARFLPFPFYVWIDSWLPHRLCPEGALVALLATSDGRSDCCRETNDYLRAVARRGHLDFLMDERTLSEPARSFRHAGARLQNLVTLPLPNHARRRHAPAAWRWRTTEEAA